MILGSITLPTAIWITLRPLGQHRRANYLRALVALSVGSGGVLILVTQVVLTPTPSGVPA